jgi:hypothetical protein
MFGKGAAGTIRAATGRLKCLEGGICPRLLDAPQRLVRTILSLCWFIHIGFEPGGKEWKLEH